MANKETKKEQIDDAYDTANAAHGSDYEGEQ